ncbi:flagellar hook-associated protein 2 [Alkalibacillus flavidus]|uniref:Flagellar hook-associated protein 2 n=1 Tax=Alkalibacillus flavidus TaxID=546021 RepID=A0ABV2KTR0_9BACI
MVSNNMDTMRMTGFASGMNIESMVNQLMQAERQPLQQMKQDQLWLTQQRDAYREVNSKMSEFENMFLDMKLSSTYQGTKSESSSDAVSVSSSSDAGETNFQIDVQSLASKAIRKTDLADGEQLFGDNFDPTSSFEDQVNVTQNQIDFTYHNENGPQNVSVDLTQMEAGYSLNDVFDEIETQSDGNVRGFYDETADEVFLERAESGNFNEGGAEIQFAAGSFLDEMFKMNPDDATEHGGTNASFTYNGVDMESTSNSYELNGATLQFNQTTDTPATISIEKDIDGAVKDITNFVDKYNELIGFMNEKVNEPRNRDYPPLTESQKSEMSDREIELWEERSKSGELRGDTIVRGAVSDMRTSWYEEVNNPDSDYNSIFEVGITTVSALDVGPNDQGKLEVDEEKLREALENDSEGVYKLFSNDTEDNSRGLLNRVEDSLEGTMDRITERAGRVTDTDFEYTMGQELISMTERVSDFERRMQQTEQRYWDQFTRMEQAIQKMNAQSQQMQQQLGGMM